MPFKILFIFYFIFLSGTTHASTQREKFFELASVLAVLAVMSDRASPV